MSADAVSAAQKKVDFDLSANDDDEKTADEVQVSALGISADDDEYSEVLPFPTADDMMETIKTIVRIAWEWYEIGQEKMYQMKKLHDEKRRPSTAAVNRKAKKTGNNNSADPMNFLLFSLFSFISALCLISVFAALSS